MARQRIVETWTDPAGTTFRLVGWPSPVPSTGLLLIHHGLGEHIGRYDSVVEGLGDLPVHVWGYDCRGHGETSGPKGDVGGLPELGTDLGVLLPVLLARAGADRVVIFGHSMGGTAVAWFLGDRGRHLDSSVAGAVICAPAVRIHKTPIMRVKLAVARIMSRIAPRMTIANEVDADTISSIPEEVRRYVEDPLVHDRISFRLGLSFVDDVDTIVERATEVRVPVLLFHGVDDRLVDIEGTRDLAAVLPNAQLHELADCRHEAHHDRGRGVMFAALRAWLGERLPVRVERAAP